LIRRAKQQSCLDFLNDIDHCQSQATVWWRFQCSRGRDIPLSTLGDSMESASPIQSSFREFSSPHIPRCPQVDS
jgi:hypothetical protein